MKVGIIGCGRIATAVHMPSLRKIQGYDLVAASDVDQTRLDETKEKFGINETYNDYRIMLAKADIDAVFVCTPPQGHFQIAMKAIEEGKHVLCEKPLATVLTDAMTIKQAYETQQKTQATHLFVMPAHNFIFTPCFTETLKLLRNNEIGKIREIRACISSNLRFYRARTNFRNEAKSGVLEDLMPHLIYLIQRIGGPLEKVSCIEPQLKGGSVNVVNIQASLTSGADADLTAKWTGLVPTLQLVLTGENGEIAMDLLRTPYNVTVKSNGESITTAMQSRLRQYVDVFRSKHPSYTLEHIHFLNCAQNDAIPQVTVDEGIELVRTLNEVTECFQGNTRVTSAQNDSVAILRVDKTNIEATVHRSIEMLGGLRTRKDDLVVIKPNVCFPSNLDSMVITDPTILQAIINAVKKKTQKVLVVESDAASGSAEKRLTKTGVMDVIEKCDAEFLNLSKDEVETHKVAGLPIAIPKTVLRADYFINLPKVKTSTFTTVTVAMKNMFGVIATQKKSQFHDHLAETLLYLNQAIRQDLILADGIVAMEGMGPIRGKKVDLGLIIAGCNPVTVDAACCHIAGFNPYAVEILWKARQKGMGEIDEQKIRFLGENIEKVKCKFSQPSMSPRNLIQAVKTEFGFRFKE